MKHKSTKTNIKTGLFPVFLILTMLVAIVNERADAKSVYVLTDIEADPQPLQAYDIGPDGSLTFQKEHYIPRIERGGVGLAIDSDNGYLFVTYEESPEISIVDATTMTNEGRVILEDAENLAGVVYDHEKQLLYCVDRGKSWLYVFRWDAVSLSLEEVSDSPFNLRRATAYGIALDEENDFLYVANASNQIYVYSTYDWSLKQTIIVGRIAVSVAVDVKNGYLYSGGGYYYNHYLTQLQLSTNTEKEILVEPDAGVMGIGVDPDTGLVYISTGADQQSGGDNLLVYNASLQRVEKIPSIGNKPTGLVVPCKNIGYNPLNLTKEAVEGVFGTDDLGEVQSVGAGGLITYNISFDNIGVDYEVTDVVVVDTLPDNVIFVSADEDGAIGHYSLAEHKYTWFYSSISSRTRVSTDMTVQVKEGVEPGTELINYATIHSSQVPQTTTAVVARTSRSPLHVRKSVSGVLEGQVKTVEPGDEITYRIHFNNYDNDFEVTDIIIVDILPEELSFVSADYNWSLGRYDSEARTYTWRYQALEPGDGTQVKLVAKVNQDVIPGTTITNYVVIDSDETAESSSSVDVVVTGEGPVNRFNLSKTVVGGYEKVSVGENVTYCICFDGNDISQPVTNVSVVDVLPQDLIFVRADGDGIIGKYDEKAHTYTWSYPFISPDDQYRLELTARVNQDAELGKTLSNLVTISSDMTPPAAASVDILTDEGGWRVESLEIIPSTIRRDSALSDIIAVLTFSEGMSKESISNEPVVLFPGNVQANQQIVIETDGKVQVVAVFNKDEVMGAIPFYGNVDVEIVGKLTTGQSFYGKATITITRFAPN